jgi:3-oxoacyl-[acyl-carrier-protein] synthase III
MSMPAPRHWRSPAPMGVMGTGAALPGDAVSNEELVALIADRFGLRRGRQALGVAERLGIRHRHICRDFNARSEAARPGDSNDSLAARALRQALDRAGLRANDLDYLIGHTATPLQQLPGNVTYVAESLGYEGPHVELRQACTGFANALAIAAGLIAQPGARPVAIIGSETGSLFFDPMRADEDNAQLVNLMQMGDGAGAVILGPPAAGCGHIETAWYGAIGNGRAPGIGIDPARPHEFAHDFAAIAASGAALFEAGVACALEQADSLDDFAAILPHQASGRIGAQLAHRLEQPESKFVVNAHRLGNTGSAAIWLSFDDWLTTAQDSNLLVLGAEASKFMFGGFVYARS